MWEVFYLLYFFDKVQSFSERKFPNLYVTKIVSLNTYQNTPFISQIFILLHKAPYSFLINYQVIFNLLHIINNNSA